MTTQLKSDLILGSEVEHPLLMHDSVTSEARGPAWPAVMLTRLKILLSVVCAFAVLLFASERPNAQTSLSSMALKTVPVPGPSAEILEEFVANRTAAIQLGKALFWDLRVGSDNKTACASCHFSAGADTRAMNQLSPGLLRRGSDSNLTPDPDRKFELGGPNHPFVERDFPFTRFADRDDNRSLRSDINDVASSQGVFHGSFNKLNVTNKGAEADGCNFSKDLDGFQLGDRNNTRRVEPRNTPTVINAVFNFRNFWDGRANNVFNGGDPFGLRNTNELVWKQEAGQLRKVSVSIPSSSLASQGSGPPLSGFEMSCSDRTFIDLGRKLLNQKILDGQTISRDDSVLGDFANGRPPYHSLVRNAFKPAYWQAPDVVRFTRNDAKDRKSMDLQRPVQFDRPLDERVSQMEANFTLFFSLSLQLYQSTLVADDSRFDQFAAGDASKLNQDEKAGWELFQGKGHCINCHGGAELTNASFRNVINQRLETMTMSNGQTKTYDNGFYNIGVRPTLDDLGVGGKDPFGFPLSETLLFLEKGSRMLGNSFNPDREPQRSDIKEVAVNGAFKTPGLRNVELTGPYFHNGGKATLMQVVDFYNRGGDFGRDNANDLDPDIQKLGLDETEKVNLVKFLLTLTDERVRMKKAPFDHPSLCLPNGHLWTYPGSTAVINAPDQSECLPAVGRNGTAVGIVPFMSLSPFSH